MVRVLAASTLLSAGCVPEGCISLYDKELESLQASEAIGEVGGIELGVDAQFSYVRYDALSGRVPWVPTAFYNGSVWLRPGEADPMSCLGPPTPVLPDGVRTCQLAFAKYDDETAWRAAHGSFEVEYCSADTRAALRIAMAGVSHPPDGWFVVEIENDDTRWTAWQTDASCEATLAIEWPHASVEADDLFVEGAGEAEPAEVGDRHDGGGAIGAAGDEREGGGGQAERDEVDERGSRPAQPEEQR